MVLPGFTPWKPPCRSLRAGPCPGPQLPAPRSCPLQGGRYQRALPNCDTSAAMTALLALWRATARNGKQSDAVIRRMALTSSRNAADLTAEVLVWRRETHAGDTAGTRLLVQSIISDAERLAGR